MFVIACHGPPDPTADGPGNGSAAATSSQPRITMEKLHTDHRYVNGAMVGGWGPHLGHLLRRKLISGGTELWFVDDSCAQNGGSPCTVTVNQRVDYLRLEAGVWTKVDSQALPSGVQQNTGSVIVNDTVYSYGLDSAAQVLWECARVMTTGAKHCRAVSSATGPGANYVGAAVSPAGDRIVWHTNVVDGGGGSLSIYANHTAWDGPRTGGLGGYNDVGYVNIAFGIEKDPNRFIMHGQFVTGLAPNWSYAAGVAEGNVTAGNAVSWATPFVPPAGDSIMSTNDVLVDPDSGDTHVIARTHAGSAVYYFRPAGGAWSRVQIWPNASRVRLVLIADRTIAMARGDTGKGLTVVLAPLAKHSAGQPIAWDRLPVIQPTLPEGYKNIYAIYPESTIYQDTLSPTLELAIVADERQNEVIHVGIDPR